jgi:hypothetical protein
MAMQAPANAPLVCHGHSRPINHLEYSNVTEDGVFLISSSKGANPPRWLSRGSTARDHPAAREHTAVPIGKRASRVISKRLLFFLEKQVCRLFFPRKNRRTAEPPNAARRTSRLTVSIPTLILTKRTLVTLEKKKRRPTHDP